MKTRILKPLKFSKISISKIYTTRQGERTTTPSQARKLKEEVDYKCQECGRSFKRLPKYLEIHHKKGIAKHKSPFGNLPVYSIGKKVKPKYERKSNKIVLCKDCHDKTKKKPKKKLNSPWYNF